MKKALLIIIFCVGVFTCNCQSSVDSIVSNIENQAKKGLLQMERKFEVSPPCESLYFYDSNKIKLIEIGCGDVSMEQTKTNFYFNNEFILYSKELTHFNAPPNFTKEKAQEEGIVKGWYDPEKTIVEIEKCYFKSNVMIKWITFSGKELQPGTNEFSIKEQQILADLSKQINAP